jgi:repressor LexA
VKSDVVPPRTLDALQAIAAAIYEEGFPPTVRELAVRLGVSSTNGVNEHLQRLTDAGLILRLGRGRARALSITPRGWLEVGLREVGLREKAAKGAA